MRPESICSWKCESQIVKNSFQNNPEALKAYTEYERRTNIRNLHIGCYLVMTLMPAGYVLDYFIYPKKAAFFLTLRLICAFFGFVVWAALRTPKREKFDRPLCVFVALLPAFFICWMIYDTEGAASSYYAGLNLVLLCVSFIVRWSVDLSLVTALSVIGMYVGACVLHSPLKSTPPGILVNNLYFLLVTALILIISGWVHRALRMREFMLSFELDKSRKALEASLQQLKENETQLVQSEKLASLGRMSAGIIHEINNPLNFATTGLFTLRKKGKQLAPEQQADYAEILNDVEDGLKRVHTIVSDLRMFTHPDTEQLRRGARGRGRHAGAAVLEQRMEGQGANRTAVLPPDQTVLGQQKQADPCLREPAAKFPRRAEGQKLPAGEKPTIWIEGRVEERPQLHVRPRQRPGH